MLVDGEVTGQEIEVIRAVMEPHGVTTIKGTIVDFNGLIPALQAGRIDAIGAAMTIRPARCEQISFANPDSITSYAFLKLANNDKELDSFADFADDSSANFGALAASQQIALAKLAGIPEDRIFEFQDVPSAVVALKNGRIDVVAEFGVVVEDLIKTNSDTDLVRVDLSEQPTAEDGKPAIGYQGVGFRKTDADLLAAFNEGLDELVESGELLSINEEFDLTEADTPDGSVTAESICSGG
jgi:polar amino acid transport system substrate-binding protein